jgi:hypothetical protein
MVMPDGLALGKVPDAPLADAIRDPVKLVDDLQMLALRSPGLCQGTAPPLGTFDFGKREEIHGHDSIAQERSSCWSACFHVRRRIFLLIFLATFFGPQ